MRFLARHIRVLLSLALLIAAGVWWGWDRIGPPLPEPTDLAEMDPEVAGIIRQALTAAGRRRGNEDLRLQLGMVYEANELPRYAQACYEQVVDARRNDLGAWYRLGSVRLKAGDLAGAIEAMERVIELDPQFVAAQALSGLWLLDSGDVERAERRLEHALELDPDHEAALFGVVRLHLVQRREDEAIALLQSKQLLAGPNTGYAYRLLATAHRQRGEAAEAQRALSRAGERRPSWPDPHADELARLTVGIRNKRAAAQTMMGAGQYKEAMSLLLQARLEDPRNPRILNPLAICQLELEQYDACLATFHDALSIDPENYWTNVNVANALWAMSRTRPVDLTVALNHADRAIELRPESAQAHSTKGRILMRLNRSAEAIDVLKHAFAIDARDPSILTQAGFLECELERFEQAIDTFEIVLEYELVSATPLVGMARACMGLGRLEQARSALDEARNRHVDHPHLLERAEQRLAAMEQGASSPPPLPEHDGSEERP